MLLGVLFVYHYQMLELYDSSPWSQVVQENRLKYARTLSNADIECLVWAEDALAFAHFVPTCLGPLQLLVADQDLHAASTQITKSLECRLFSGFNPRHVESILLDPSQPKAFPYSVCLETTIAVCNRTPDDPDFIFIHPQSQFYFNIQDKSRSLSLTPFPDNIRFPTITAFIDSMIATYLDPPSGRIHSKVSRPMKVWLSYLLTYTLTLHNRASVLPNGDLELEHAEVLRSLKPENQAFFDSYVRSNHIAFREHQIRRKEILERLGRHEEARRPFPTPNPGNPELRAQKSAKFANMSGNQKRSYSTFRGAQSTIMRFSRLLL